jgi:hypothetical protein
LNNTGYYSDEMCREMSGLIKIAEKEQAADSSSPN